MTLSEPNIGLICDDHITPPIFRIFNQTWITNEKYLFSFNWNLLSLNFDQEFFWGCPIQGILYTSVFCFCCLSLSDGYNPNSLPIGFINRNYVNIFDFIDRVHIIFVIWLLLLCMNPFLIYFEDLFLVCL